MSQARDLRIVKLLYFFYYAAFGIYTVFINVYYHLIGLSGVQIGWINAIAPLVGILAGPLWGIINDRTGRPRLITALGVIGSTAAMLGIGGVQTFIWILPLAGMFQLFNSVLIPMMDMTNLSVLGEHTELYGRQRIWGSIGYVATTSVVGLVLQKAGLHWLFYGYAIIMLVMLGVVGYFPGGRGRTRSAINWNLRDLVGQRAWIFFAASLIPLWMASQGMYTFLGVYLKELGGSDWIIGMNSSIGAITEMPAMIFGAVLIRRLGLKRMLWIAYLMYAIRYLLYGLIPSPGWALLVSCMHGLSFGLFWVSANVYLTQLAPPHLRTTNQTLFAALMSLAGVIGSPASGWVFDTLGPAWLFRIFSVVVLVALVILLMGFRNRAMDE